MNSPTVGAAVEDLVRYLGFHQTGAEISAKQDRRYWRIAYRVLHSRVEQAVAQALHSGQHRIALVARTLGMGERTLQRRLSERGLTFNDVVDQVRERLARQNVARDDVTLTEVAFLLGYSESSAFIRAFRRWTGETPLAYRKRALA